MHGDLANRLASPCRPRGANGLAIASRLAGQRHAEVEVSSSHREPITTDPKLPGKVEHVGDIAEPSARIAVFHHKAAELDRTFEFECHQEPLAGFELHLLDIIGPTHGASTASNDRREEDGGGNRSE